jgi:hypothetical protein
MTTADSQDIFPEKKLQPAFRWPAVFFSYLFHPIFVPVYVIAFLVYVHPSYFSGFSEKAKLQTLIISVINMVLFPLFSILLMKPLKFIDSVFLRTQKDRIIPYIVCGIFFFWSYLVFKRQEMYPPVISSFIFGVFLAVSAALIANIYFKISMHTIGMGGWLGIFWIIYKENSMLMTWPLASVILLTGIVCTSRLLISDHKQKDIYAGLALGFSCQLVAAFVN